MMQRGKRSSGVRLLHAAVIGELDELFLGRGHVEDALIKDREARPALRHDVRRVAGISGAFVAEALSGAVHDDAALLDRGPRQEAAVRIGHRGVTLIGADIAERGAELLTPKHRLASAAARAEILRAAYFGAEPRHEIAVSRKTIYREDDLARGDPVALAVAGLDIGAGHRTIRIGNQLTCPIADRERNAALVRRGQKIVHEILPAT